MQLGDEGDDVRKLQLALEWCGYPMPKYGADGDFGRETLAALLQLAADHEHPWSGVGHVPDELLEVLDVVVADDELELFGDFDPQGVPFEDLRATARDPHPKAKRGRDGKTLRRSPRAVDAIVLHQTAIKFSPPASNRTPAGLHRRARDVACHAMAFHDGTLVAAAPLDWHIYHADMINARALGLEVDGNFPGLIGREVATGRESELTDELVEAARAGVRWLVTEGRRLGMPIRWIFAHRQCDSWRRADPGEGLWRKVVLEYAVPELKLRTDPTRTWAHREGPSRHGKPVPTRWDPAGRGPY